MSCSTLFIKIGSSLSSFGIRWNVQEVYGVRKSLGGLGAELFGLKESETEKLQDFDEFVRWLGYQNLDSGEVHIRKQTALIPVEEMDFIGTLQTLE